MEKTCKTPRKDLIEHYRRCWSPPCKKSAFFQDWGGWNWCWKHAWREIIINETWGDVWFEIKNMKVRNPYYYPFTN